MPLTFSCPLCDKDIEIQSADDELPDVKLKFRRVERQCRACGYTHVGLDAPDKCPGDDCPDPALGWGPAERVVADTADIQICTDCQENVDTDAVLDALS